MTGTIVNMLAVLSGGAIGLLISSKFPKKLSDALFKAMGLCVLYIGISGVLKGKNHLIAIISMAIGTIIGELANLDGNLNSLGNKLQSYFKNGSQKNSVAEGFVSASLLFCVGAMAIVGSLRSGLTGDNSMIYTKSLIDFISAIIFASSFGIGVLFSSLFVLIYQGSIVLIAQWISPYLSDAAVAEMTCVGSLIIIALALNMLSVGKFKVMNFVPAMFLPILLCMFI